MHWNIVLLLKILLLAGPGRGGKVEVDAGPRELTKARPSRGDEGQTDEVLCLAEPILTHLDIGDYIDFHTNNYPDGYKIFERCSWLFETTPGAKLSLTCSSVELFWLTYLYIVDGEKTLSHNCWWCSVDRFEFEFVSTRVQVGLRNWFFFTGSGFSCTISASGISSKDDCNCGVVNSETRIIGGKETAQNAYPWMTSLVLVTRADFPFCGGALISDQFVLTAAHCTVKQRAQDIAVILGRHNTGVISSSSVRRSVQRSIRHPRYDDDTNDYDVCLLKIATVDILSRAFPLIRPICLPSTNKDYEGAIATVAGWGTTEEDGSASQVLLEVQVPVISNWECDFSYGYVTDRMLCAGSQGLDSCQGDSGGGLWTAAGGGSPHKEVIGVVSFGHGCGEPNYPGVYTRVTEVQPWIISETRGSTTCPPPTG